VPEVVRLHHVRFTVRQMMAAVLAAAVALVPIAHLVRRAAYWEQRRIIFRNLADYHAARVVGYSVDCDSLYPRFFDRYGNPVSARQGNADLWHSNMSAKYRRAVEQPWEPVPAESEPHWECDPDVPPLSHRPTPGATPPVLRSETLTPIAAELRRQALYSRRMKRQSANAASSQADSTSPKPYRFSRICWSSATSPRLLS
jgi:hypothetical protein